MKKWTRWQDWVAVAVGVVAALSTLWTDQAGMSMTLMIVFGVLLVASGLVNLAMPGMPAVEWAQVVIALLLFLSPWLGSYTEQTGAAWTSWIGGAIAVIVTAIAIRPSMDVSHHRVMPSH
jgi:SPW repeat